MLRIASIALFLGLAACGGGSKAGGGGGGGGGSGDGSDSEPPDETSAKPCCCETYDLGTPDILYSTMPAKECAAAEGHCEDTTEYCEGE